MKIVGTGIVSMTDRYDCARRATEDASIPRHTPILIDVSEATVPPNAFELRAVAFVCALLQAHFRARVAIYNCRAGNVTASSAVAFAADSGGEGINAFTRESAALDWLNQGRET